MEGKFVIHRKLLESEIWDKPAYYLKIWIWILAKAKWKTNKKGGQTFKRGEFKTDYLEIIEENRYKIGYRYERLNKNDIFYVLNFLRKTDRIRTKKTTKGLWIKVLNYDESQLIPRFYEASTKQTRNKQRSKQEINSKRGDEANSEANTIKTEGKHHTSNTRAIQEKYTQRVVSSKELNGLIKKYGAKQVKDAVKLYQVRKNTQNITNPIGYIISLCQQKVSWKNSPESEGEKYMANLEERSKRIKEEVEKYNK